jgi:hypothetical protein
VLKNIKLKEKKKKKIIKKKILTDQTQFPDLYLDCQSQKKAKGGITK